MRDILCKCFSQFIVSLQYYLIFNAVQKYDLQMKALRMDKGGQTIFPLMMQRLRPIVTFLSDIDIEVTTESVYGA